MKLGLALPGPHRSEAERIQKHCVDAGMSWKRAYAVACMASIGEVCWMFQSTVAVFTGSSVRTIQRAMRQAKALGVLVSRRLRRGERPEGARQPITCGGALRRFTAWGVPAARAAARYAKHALRWIWRLDSIAKQKARERDEIDAAVAEFRSRPPP